MIDGPVAVSNPDLVHENIREVPDWLLDSCNRVRRCSLLGSLASIEVRESSIVKVVNGTQMVTSKVVTVCRLLEQLVLSLLK